MIQILFIAKSQGICWDHWDWWMMEQAMGRRYAVLPILFSFSPHPPGPGNQHLRTLQVLGATIPPQLRSWLLCSPLPALFSIPPARWCAGFSTHASSCHSNRWCLVKGTGPGLHLLAAVFCHSWQNYFWTWGRKTAARTSQGDPGCTFMKLACVLLHVQAWP